MLEIIQHYLESNFWLNFRKKFCITNGISENQRLEGRRVVEQEQGH